MEKWHVTYSYEGMVIGCINFWATDWQNAQLLADRLVDGDYRADVSNGWKETPHD